MSECCFSSTTRRECDKFFFFSSRRRHTRCLSDWSSDVCSSDLCVIGGLEGRAIREGDVLPVGSARPAAAGRTVEERLRTALPKEVELRVNMGLCDYRLTEEGRRSFLESEWTVTPAADRIGYRYRGGQLSFVAREQPFGAGSDPSNVVDLGYPV